MTTLAHRFRDNIYTVAHRTALCGPVRDTLVWRMLCFILYVVFYIQIRLEKLKTLHQIYRSFRNLSLYSLARYKQTIAFPKIKLYRYLFILINYDSVNTNSIPAIDKSPVRLRKTNYKPKHFHSLYDFLKSKLERKISKARVY